MSLATFYKDKVVIITGASMGIGKELARQLSSDCGAKIVITGRTLDKLETVKKELNIADENILLHAGDVSNPESNAMMVQECLTKFGRIDVLINNAGLSAFGSLEKIETDVFKKVVDTNIYGSIFPTKSCIPALKNSKGSVMFISSIAGLTGLADYSAYSLSKMAVRAMAHALRIELNEAKVFVGINYVGFTENEKSKQTFTPSGELVEVPKRPAILTSTREKTAKKILLQIKRKKYSSNQSILGHIVMFQSKVFPKLTAWIMRSRYKPQA
jgi:short-subunit dehydrogenase